MTEVASAFVRVRPEMRGFKSETESGVKRGFGGVGKIMAGAFAGMAAFSVIKGAFAELKEGQLVAAQTAAVLKSTGNVANTSAGQIDALANSLLRKTGVDDEAIKSGANLLLTFTNVRNEAGLGNDIFNQATKTVLDMSVALGTDAKSSAIQLGKALNDPIKGITALQRVGVSFTAAQKEQIAAMVKSGDTMGAHKLILAELNKEFGGSAEAAGKTLPGQLNILKESFANLSAEALSALVPSLTTLAGFLSRVLPGAFEVLGRIISFFSGQVQGIASFLAPALMPLVEMVKRVVLVFQELGAGAGFETLRMQFFALSGPAKAAAIAIAGIAAALAVAFVVANPVTAAVLAIVGLAEAFKYAYDNSQRFREIVQTSMEVVRAVVGAVTAYLSDLWRKHGAEIIATAQAVFGGIRTIVETVVAVVRALWSRFGNDIVALARNAWTTLKTVIDSAITVITGIIRLAMALIQGEWGKAWEALKSIVGAVLTGMVAIMRGYLTHLALVARAMGKAILDGILAGLKALARLVMGALEALGGAIAEVGDLAFEWAKALGGKIVSGVLAGIASLPGKLKGAISGGIGSALSKVDIPGRSPPEHAAAEAIGKPLARGVILGWLNGTADLPTKISERLRNALDAGKRVVDAARAEFATAFGRLTGDIGSAFDALTAAFKTPAEKMLAAIDKSEALKRMSDQISDAMKAITEQFGATKANVDAYNQALASQQEAVGRLAEAQARLDEVRQSGAAETSAEFLTATRKVTDAQQAVEEFGAKAAEMKEKIELGPKIQADITAYNDALKAQTAAVLALSAAQQKLNELRAAGASAKAIAGAQTQVKTAQGVVTTADAQVSAARGTLEAEGIAPNDLDALLNAQLETRKYYLALEAAEQRKQFDAQRALAKRHLEDRLTDLQTELAKHPGEHKRIQAEIVALLKSYGVNYKNAGAALGRAFAAGLRESIGEVESAAEAIARAIEKVLRLKSPAEEGPLAGIGTWWKALPSTLLGGMDAGAIPAAFGDMAGAARGALSGAFGGGGQTDISAAVEEARVTRDREIVEELRRQTGMGEQANATSAEAMGQVVALLQAAVGLLAERRPVSVSGLFDPNAIAAEAVR